VEVKDRQGATFRVRLRHRQTLERDTADWTTRLRKIRILVVETTPMHSADLAYPHRCRRSVSDVACADAAMAQSILNLI
jgi:hypothetical protein